MALFEYGSLSSSIVAYKSCTLDEYTLRNVLFQLNHHGKRENGEVRKQGY
jgi:hypothetical protein